MSSMMQASATNHAKLVTQEMDPFVGKNALKGNKAVALCVSTHPVNAAQMSKMSSKTSFSLQFS